LESSIKITIGLGIIIVLLGSYLFLSGSFNQFALTTRTEEQLIIPTENLKECCSYLDKEGNEKTCSIFVEYSCDNCKPLCEPS
tara:strand:+ start:461 stop:709 length:249 start_codon:yes stop_codon:yes gene_type:complete